MKIASPQWHDLHAEQLVSLAQQQDSESAGRLCSSYLVHKRRRVMVPGVPSGECGN